MLFLLGYNFLFNGEGELTLMWRIKIWWWGESIVRGNFLSGRGGGGEDEQIFGWCGGTSPYPPSKEISGD